MSPVVTQDKKFADRLAGYVEVKDRIKLFRDAFPTGSLVTDEVRATNEPDGTPRVWVKALAYRSPDDPHPAVGWSWMVLPGSTNYTRGSELENTETSAWGRAIGALGIGIDKSIASRQEVQNKEHEGERPAEAGNPDGSVLGVAEKGKGNADFELRQVKTKEWPDEHPMLAFRLVEGRRGIKTIAEGPLAEMVAEYREGIEGQRVACWGRIATESFDKTVGDQVQTITYQVLHLERLKVGQIDLAAPEPDDEPTAEAAEFDSGWLDKVPA